MKRLGDHLEPRKTQDVNATIRLEALFSLALVLIEHGTYPILVSPAAGVLALQVEKEIIQAAVVGGECVLVTESGTVLGYSTDPDIEADLISMAGIGPNPVS